MDVLDSGTFKAFFLDYDRVVTTGDRFEGIKPGAVRGHCLSDGGPVIGNDHSGTWECGGAFIFDRSEDCSRIRALGE